MKTKVLVCFLCLISLLGHGQQLLTLPFKTIKVEGLDRLSVDNRDNIFYSDIQGNVFKLDLSGEIINQYSPTLQGRLSQLDAFSTMILFLFSVDLQQVTLLDSHLSPLQQISVQDEAVGFAKAAALGNNHVFWLFDEGDWSLKKYDYRRSETLQSQPLLPLVGNHAIEVTEILEKGNMVLVHLKDHGLWLFDNQANLIKKYAISFDHPIAVYDDQVYFLKDEHLRRLDLFSGVESSVGIPEVPGHGVAVSSQYFLIYSDDTLYLFPKARGE